VKVLYDVQYLYTYIIQVYSVLGMYTTACENIQMQYNKHYRIACRALEYSVKIVQYLLREFSGSLHKVADSRVVNKRIGTENVFTK